MSFWKTNLRKSRKEHTCVFCKAKIKIKDEYVRVTGSRDNDKELDDYCLCKRCSWFIGRTRIRADEELGSLMDDIEGLELIECSKCGSDRYERSMNTDKTSINMLCNDCGHTESVDISIEGLERLLNKQLSSD